MKYYYTLLVFFCAGASLLAQISLEHTYPAGYLQRINLDATGTHYLLSRPYCKIDLHDETHALRFTRPLSWYEECSNFFLSEQLIDTDPGVELFYNWLDAGIGGSFGVVIEDDNGATLHTGATFSRVDGLAPRPVSGKSVLKLPGLAVEHTYPFEFQRANFEVWGETFYYFDNTGQPGYHFFNGQHELVQSVPLDIPGCEASQQLYDQDDQIEFSQLVWAPEDPLGNRKVFKVFEADGSLRFQGNCEFTGGTRDYLALSGYDQPDHFSTTIFNRQTFEQLHVFPFWANILTLPNGGLYYYHTSARRDTLSIYNEQFNLEKRIYLPPGTPQGNNWGIQIGKGNVTMPAKWEVLYSTALPGGDPPYQVFFRDEDGQLSGVFLNAFNGRLDVLEGSPNKLIIQYRDSVQVYGLGASSGTSYAPTGGIHVSPNPFSTILAVQLDNPEPYTWRITDTRGTALLAEEKTAHHQNLDLSQLPTGCYFLSINQGNRSQTVKIIKLK